MRDDAAGLNRGWLAVIGLVLLLGGALLVLISTGTVGTAGAAVGLRWDGPAADARVIPGGSAWSALWVAVVVVAAGVVVGLLGLGWLLAQIPRRRQARPFRLHDTADHGSTICDPSVLTAAVEAQTEALPGVESASAVLRGTAAQPELTLRVTASDRADLTRLLQRIEGTVAAGLGQALDTQVHRLAVQLEIDRPRTSPRSSITV